MLGDGTVEGAKTEFINRFLDKAGFRWQDRESVSRPVPNKYWFAQSTSPQLSLGSAVPLAPPARAPLPASFRFAKELGEIEGMGFDDRSVIMRTLVNEHGNVPRTVDILLGLN